MVARLDLAAVDLPTRHALEGISLAVSRSKRIIVVTGAGISCSCGIPVRPIILVRPGPSNHPLLYFGRIPQDFRSPNGLYNLVKSDYPDVVMKGRDLFDATLFRDPELTAVFCTFISKLKRSVDVAQPSPTHVFIKILDEKNKLLRSYTQNIDGLEERVGLVGSSAPGASAAKKLQAKNPRNVQLHGNIHRVRCNFCSVDLPCTEEHVEILGGGQAPDCPECAARGAFRPLPHMSGDHVNVGSNDSSRARGTLRATDQMRNSSPGDRTIQ